MRYQRAELHNHTTESDGAMTVEELLEYAEERAFSHVALTDHNTCSGWSKAEKLLSQSESKLQLVRGIEFTTFYGHLIGLGAEEMIRFEELDPSQPEIFLRKIKTEAKAKAVGIAHPFCVGEPVMVGCRCGLQITDWSCVDYLEVFNTSAGTSSFGNLLVGNAFAFALWKKLVLQGKSVAAVTGKDIHRKQPEEPVFITWLLCPEEESEREQTGEERVIEAILDQRTIVTKGPRFFCKKDVDGVRLYFDHTSNYFDWAKKAKEITMLLRLTESDGTEKTMEISAGTDWVMIADELEEPIVVELFEGECQFEQLLAAGVFHGRNVQ